MSFLIRNGDVLVEGAFARSDILAHPDGIRLDPFSAPGAMALDAGGLVVLPGIIDVHGDAFERQIMPRPGVGFPLDVALMETDRQLAANGITTAYHGVTWSWEPGLRGSETAIALIDAIGALRPRLRVDTRFHLRHETYNLEGEAVILEWIAAGRIGVLAFNDHMESIVKAPGGKRAKLGKTIERSGLSEEAFHALVDRVWARRDEVPGSIERLAAAAVAAGVPVMSHDDRNPEDRRWYRARGCAISEFPMSEDAAREAIGAGEATVFGAPNVVRGGSHNGDCPAASDMVAKGLCSILASDYYYPALALAPGLLEMAGVARFAQAWALISTNPARGLRLHDRGMIAEGLRADLVLAKRHGDRLEIVATFVAGELVHLSEGARLSAA
jgi:alpha-D-ribose 1-methylphosphonate 5-triphosphate diphosphatase